MTLLLQRCTTNGKQKKNQVHMLKKNRNGYSRIKMLYGIIQHRNTSHVELKNNHCYKWPMSNRALLENARKRPPASHIVTDGEANSSPWCVYKTTEVCFLWRRVSCLFMPLVRVLVAKNPMLFWRTQSNNIYIKLTIHTGGIYLFYNGIAIAEYL